MTSIVPVAGSKGAWTQWELEALADMQRALEERGLPTDYEHGITDEGVPWISFYDAAHSWRTSPATPATTS